MSDEYEYGPWIDVPVGGRIQVMGPAIVTPDEYDAFKFRIATPKPKRELVVGKWYRDHSGFWRKCIYVCDGSAWLTVGDNHDAPVWSADGSPRSHHRAYAIDWSTPPRDEAPE